MKFSIEQLSKIQHQKDKAIFCSSWFITTYRETDSTVFVKVHPILCHSYYCAHCSKIRKAQLYTALSRWSRKRHLRFMTLTYSHDESPIEIINRFSKDWNKFITYIRRAGHSFNYFKVIEFTRSGYVHFHVLVDRSIPQHLISSIWHDITSHSYIVDIRSRMSNRRAINYSLKYFIKSFEGSADLFIALGIRRYSFSKFTYNFQSDRPQPEEIFHLYLKLFPDIESIKLHYKTLYPGYKISGRGIENPDLVFL